MVNLNCQLDGIQNHHGNNVLSGIVYTRLTERKRPTVHVGGTMPSAGAEVSDCGPWVCSCPLLLPNLPRHSGPRPLHCESEQTLPS